MKDERVIKRPDWWYPGCAHPLPPLSASNEYTGSGALRSGGKVTVTRQPVRWETVEEWTARRNEPQ